MCNFLIIWYNSFMKQVISIIKALINLKVNNFSIKNEGTIDNNILFFKDNNVSYTFNLNNLELFRKNDEFTSIMNFTDKEYIYYLNELSDNNKIYSKIVIKELLKDNCSVIIKYRIEESDFELLLSYKEMSL